MHTKWSPSEEKLFAEYWIAASEDERVGRSQARDTFWQCVQREFNQKNSKERNKDMLQGKWKTLNRDCGKFNAIFKQAERDIKSGESPMDVLTRAKQIYREQNRNIPFNNEEAWDVLRKRRKWDAPDPIDLTGDVPSQTNEALFGQDVEPHPMGKKRASKKQKSETTTSTGGTTNTGGSFTSFQFGEAMHQEFRAKREFAEKAYEAAAKRDHVTAEKEKNANETQGV